MQAAALIAFNLCFHELFVGFDIASIKGVIYSIIDTLTLLYIRLYLNT
jgi:hypothetical protein